MARRFIARRHHRCRLWHLSIRALDVPNHRLDRFISRQRSDEKRPLHRPIGDVAPSPCHRLSIVPRRAMVRHGGCAPRCTRLLVFDSQRYCQRQTPPLRSDCLFYLPQARFFRLPTLHDLGILCASTHRLDCPRRARATHFQLDRAISMVPSRSTFPHHIHITITPLGRRQSPSAMSFRLSPQEIPNPHAICGDGVRD